MFALLTILTIAISLINGSSAMLVRPAFPITRNRLISPFVTRYKPTRQSIARSSLPRRRDKKINPNENVISPAFLHLYESNLEALEKCLNSDHDPTRINEFGLTLEETAKLLSDQPMNEFEDILDVIQRKNLASGHLLLHEAVLRNDFNRVHRLLRSNVDYRKEVNHDLKTAEDLAKVRYHYGLLSEEIMRLFSFTGASRLHEVVEQGDVAELEKLLKNGADTTVINDEGITALEFARITWHGSQDRLKRMEQLFKLHENSSPEYEIFKAILENNLEGALNALRRGLNLAFKNDQYLRPKEFAEHRIKAGLASASILNAFDNVPQKVRIQLPYFGLGAAPVSVRKDRFGTEPEEASITSSVQSLWDFILYLASSRPLPELVVRGIGQGGNVDFEVVWSDVFYETPTVTCNSFGGKIVPLYQIMEQRLGERRSRRLFDLELSYEDSYSYDLWFMTERYLKKSGYNGRVQVFFRGNSLENIYKIYPYNLITRFIHRNENVVHNITGYSLLIFLPIFGVLVFLKLFSVAIALSSVMLSWIIFAMRNLSNPKGIPRIKVEYKLKSDLDNDDYFLAKYGKILAEAAEKRLFRRLNDN